VLKSPPIANLQNVMPHSKNPTVQPLTDRNIVRNADPSQKQKSCKADTQANAICGTFTFAQPHHQATSENFPNCSKRHFYLYICHLNIFKMEKSIILTDAADFDCCIDLSAISTTEDCNDCD